MSLPTANSAPSRPVLLAIVGPTGSGKSALALALASELDGEIINCDSLQLYRGLDIGTAKTPLHQRRAIPHHLLDVLSLEQSYSAGEYARHAAEIISQVSERRRLPILAGGTGFYLKALLEGLPPLPERDEALRARLASREETHPGILHRLLRRLDPQSAAGIHAADTQKLMRALEIRLLTGKSRAQASAARPLDQFHVVKIGLDPDRKQLRERLKARTQAIFSGGLLREVQDLLSAGAKGQEKPFEALGYRQALAHLRGEITLDQAIESTWIATCQYAKRQRTWFRRDPEIVWLNGFGDSPQALDQARKAYTNK